MPGILAASVHREPDQPNVVHDIRIFANHAAFQARRSESVHVHVHEKYLQPARVSDAPVHVRSGIYF